MKDESSLVSIILPVYNAQLYIESTIESVRQQIYKNWELIVVDDGSSDESLEICNSIAECDDRISVFSKKNGGVSEARNFGIENAKGSFISFIDDDDLYDPAFLECGMASITEYDADFYKCGREDYYLNENSEITRRVVRNLPDFFVGSAEEFKSNYMRYRKSGIAAPVWNALYRKNIITEHTIAFDERCKYGQEDILFNSEYCKYINTAVVSEKEYYKHFIRGGKSTSSKFAFEQLDFKKLSIEAEKSLLDHRCDDELDALKIVECFEMAMLTASKSDFYEALSYMRANEILVNDKIVYENYSSMTMFRRVCFFLISNGYYNLYYSLVNYIQLRR